MDAIRKYIIVCALAAVCASFPLQAGHNKFCKADDVYVPSDDEAETDFDTDVESDVEDAAAVEQTEKVMVSLVQDDQKQVTGRGRKKGCKNPHVTRGVPRLTAQQRDIILKKHKEGYSFDAIAKLAGCGRTSVHRFVCNPGLVARYEQVQSEFALRDARIVDLLMANKDVDEHERPSMGQIGELVAKELKLDKPIGKGYVRDVRDRNNIVYGRACPRRRVSADKWAVVDAALTRAQKLYDAKKFLEVPSLVLIAQACSMGIHAVEKRKKERKLTFEASRTGKKGTLERAALLIDNLFAEEPHDEQHNEPQEEVHEEAACDDSDADDDLPLTQWVKKRKEKGVLSHA